MYIGNEVNVQGGSRKAIIDKKKEFINGVKSALPQLSELQVLPSHSRHGLEDHGGIWDSILAVTFSAAAL